MSKFTTGCGLLALAALLYAVGQFVGPIESRALAGPAPESPLQTTRAVPDDLDEWADSLDEPGPNHKLLDPLVGTWEGRMSVWDGPGGSPEQVRGQVEREWVLGRRFLREVMEVETEEGTYRGVGFIGYNNADAQYEIVYLDNISTGIYMETGRYDPRTRVLVTAGSQRDPATGFVMRNRTELHLAARDQTKVVVFSTGEDGKEFTAIEGTLERKKK